MYIVHVTLCACMLALYVIVIYINISAFIKNLKKINFRVIPRFRRKQQNSLYRLSYHTNVFLKTKVLNSIFSFFGFRLFYFFMTTLLFIVHLIHCIRKTFLDYFAEMRKRSILFLNPII